MKHELGKLNTLEATDPRCNTLGQIRSCPAPPGDPCVLTVASELRNYVLELGNLSGLLNSMLFGAGKESNDCVDLQRDGIEGVLADTCQRAASLCGYLRTINGRLGGN